MIAVDGLSRESCHTISSAGFGVAKSKVRKVGNRKHNMCMPCDWKRMFWIGALLLLQQGMGREPSPGIELLVGSKLVAQFLEDVWNHPSWHHLVCLEACDRFEHLWSPDIVSNMFLSRFIKPAQYETEVKLVKQGRTHFTSSSPATWQQLQKGFAEGASIVIMSAQSKHFPLFQFCRNLELDLNVWTYVNAYLTPAGAQGFTPHWDGTDTFIIQIQGEKHWWMCQKENVGLRLNKTEASHFREEDLRNCTDVILRVGDVLFIPAGTVHYAVALRQASSLHLTVTVDRPEMSWGVLLNELANGEETDTFTKESEALVKELPGLQRQLPLVEFARSIDNEDLPKGLVNTWREILQSIIADAAGRSESTHSHMRKRLSKQLKSKTAWGYALGMMRQRLVMGALKTGYRCLGLGGSSLEHDSFRRTARIQVGLFTPEKGVLLLGVGGEQMEMKESWKTAVRFALGAFDNSTTRGSPFTLASLMAKMGNSANASDLLRQLINSCAVEPAVSMELGATKHEHKSSVNDQATIPTSLEL